MKCQIYSLKKKIVSTRKRKQIRRANKDLKENSQFSERRTLDAENASVEDTVTEYTLALTEMKTKLRNTKLVIAGLPPRHNTTEIRTKVKDCNEEMKKWCDANEMTYINNEE